ncbi:MAG TPA: O-methyltransferase [Solirubrobacterales bacterium]|nr:O-methyltransferase [Solirubrobacterales bacterium]
MAQDTWTGVDEYVTGLLAPPDQALDAAVRAGEAAGLPQIQVSPPQGKFLNLLAKTIGARSIFEFGTLAGYSTIWLARALPAGGRLITLEANPEYAEVAAASIAAAGLGEVVEIRVGPALDQLPQLAADGVGPFDLTFIDADKVHTPDYFSWTLEHVRPGSLIVADNVVRDGRLADLGNDDPAIEAQRRFHELLADEPRVEATTIQTVGGKGYDGFSLIRVLH